MSTIHIKQIVETKQVYAAFPRPGWEGRVILYVAGSDLSSIGHGERVEARVDDQKLEMSVLETPFMRYPAPNMKALHVDAKHHKKLQAMIKHGQVNLELVSDA